LTESSNHAVTDTCDTDDANQAAIANQNVANC